MDNGKEIITRLRDAIPIPGDDWTHLWILIVEPGAEVTPHSHTGWVACTHEHMKGEPPIQLNVNGMLVTMEPRKTIVIPPRVEHSVPVWEGSQPRKSYALEVVPGDARRLVKQVIRRP